MPITTDDIDLFPPELAIENDRDIRGYLADNFLRIKELLDAFSASGEANTASNVGGGTGIWKQKTGVDLEFKSLTSTGSSITLSGGVSTVNLEVNPAGINHDSLLGYDANDHVDHTSVSITAGAGLTGGGTIAATRTLDVGAGTGITVAADSVGLDTAHARNVDHTTIDLTAGAGLTGGGTIDANRTFAVGAGVGITVNADDVALDTTHIRNVDHSAVTLTAGAGLTGGGAIDANRTFAVGAGTGITVNADDVALDTANTRNVDHTLIDIIAGNGLTGGGTIDNSRTLTVGQGTGITVSANDVALDTAHARNVDHSAVSINTGTGLTGGGDISATRSLSLSHLGLETITAPAADRIFFYDFSASSSALLTVGDGLAISTTTLAVTADVLRDADIGVQVQAYDADLTTWAGLTPSANAQSLVTAANYAAMRGLLDLEAGTDFYSIAGADAAFQPLDTQLTSLAGLSYTGNALKAIRVNAGETGFELVTISAGGIGDGDTLTIGLTFPNTGLHILDTDASHDLIIAPGSNLTADRTLTITTGDADRTLDISAANVTISSYMAGLLDDANEATFKASVNLEIGVDVQAFDQQLSDLAALSYAGNTLKVVRVNAGETAFELATLSASGGDPNFVGQNATATPSAAGSNALAMGHNSNASASNSIAIGQNADATATGAIAVGGSSTDGSSADATATSAIAIGVNTDASDTSAIAIGDGAQALAVDAISLGAGASVAAALTWGIAIGASASVTASGGIAIGKNADASGVNAIAIGGNSTDGTSADATATDAIAIGQNADASGTDSLAIGLNAAASAADAFAIGQDASASAADAKALGRDAKAEWIGKLAFANGSFAAIGDAQTFMTVCRGTTTDATPTNINPDGGTTNRMIVPIDTLWAFFIQVAAREQSTGDSKVWEIRGAIKRNGTTTTELVDGVSTDLIATTGGAVSAWTVAVTADNTNEALQIEVTGEAATTLRWVATVQITEVSG